MIRSFCLIARSVNRSIPRSLDRCVARSVGRVIAGLLVDGSVVRSVRLWVARFPAQPPGHSVAQSLARSYSVSIIDFQRETDARQCVQKMRCGKSSPTHYSQVGLMRSSHKVNKAWILLLHICIKKVGKAFEIL